MFSAISAQDLLALAASGGLGAAGLKLADTILGKRRSPEQRMHDSAAALGDSATAAAALMDLALKAAGTNVEQLMARLEAVEENHRECEDRCRELTNNLAQANQKLDSLVRVLRDPKSTQPGGALHGAFIKLEDNGVEVYTQPAPRRRRKPS